MCELGNEVYVRCVRTLVFSKIIMSRTNVQRLTAFDGDTDGTLLGLFEGDWLGVDDGSFDGADEGVLLGLLEGDRLGLCVGCGCMICVNEDREKAEHNM